MNWGNKILITFLVFGSGMGFLVYKAVSTNYELVEKDYYKNELHYQQVIDATNRVNELKSPVKINQTADGILLQLPEEMKNNTITGKVWFYCEYDKNKDKKIELNVNANAEQIFTPQTVSKGTYTVKISWDKEGQQYYSENKLTVL